MVFRIALHLVVLVLMTVFTQIGGVAWVLAMWFRRRLLVFVASYTMLSLSVVWVAPTFGREALSCLDRGSLQVQSWIYCALNRNYVEPELKEILKDTAEEMDERFPGTITVVLDANFPFVDGFPLLPHLSHDDGEKVDLAFYYRDEQGYLPGVTRSPVGYFAFEDGPTNCSREWPTLRWNLGVLQTVWRDLELDEERNRVLLQSLARNSQVGKIFVEPHLVRTLSVEHANIRFQGCRAARHDDHIHVQLR